MTEVKCLALVAYNEEMKEVDRSHWLSELFSVLCSWMILNHLKIVSDIEQQLCVFILLENVKMWPDSDILCITISCTLTAALEQGCPNLISYSLE